MWVFQVGPVVKSPSASAGDAKRCRFDPWVRKIPWWRAWQPTPVFSPGESHIQRSLVGYSLGVIKSWTQLSDGAHTGAFSLFFWLLGVF